MTTLARYALLCDGCGRDAEIGEPFSAQEARDRGQAVGWLSDSATNLGMQLPDVTLIGPVDLCPNCQEGRHHAR